VDNSIATLQNKLETTRADIRTLSNENAQLRKMLYTPAKTVGISPLIDRLFKYFQTVYMLVGCPTSNARSLNKTS